MELQAALTNSLPKRTLYFLEDEPGHHHDLQKDLLLVYKEGLAP